MKTHRVLLCAAALALLGLRVDPAARTLWACSGAGPSSGELDGTSRSEEVLESRNPLFDIPTTGVLAGGALAVIANSQLDRLDELGRLKPGADLREAVILEIPAD